MLQGPRQRSAAKAALAVLASLLSLAGGTGYPSAAQAAPPTPSSVKFAGSRPSRSHLRARPCRPAGTRLLVKRTWVIGKRWVGFCLDAGSEDNPAAERARAKRAGVKLPLCAAYDVRRGRFVGVKAAPPVPPKKPFPTAKLRVGKRSLTVCKRAGSCVTLRTHYPGANSFNAAAVDASFKRAVALAPVPGTGKNSIPKVVAESFDIAAKRSLKRFTVNPGAYDDQRARWLGPRTVMFTGYAAGPDAFSRLYDAVSGKLLATVRRRRGRGKKAGLLNRYDHEPRRVGPDRWAFLDAAGDVLMIYDTRSGRVRGRVALGRYYADRTRKTFEGDSRSDFVAVGRRLVVVLGSPTAQDDRSKNKGRHVGRPGTVVVVDGRSGRVKRVRRMRVCKRRRRRKRKR